MPLSLKLKLYREAVDEINNRRWSEGKIVQRKTTKVKVVIGSRCPSRHMPDGVWLLFLTTPAHRERWTLRRLLDECEDTDGSEYPEIDS